MQKEKKNKKVNKTTRIGSNLNFASKEAFNLLRTNITFALPDEKSGKLIGVTSACPHEGKSTVAVNLAYSLADGGYNVLLVDSDMRRPTIYSTLGLPMEPGLSNMLTGKSDKAIHKAVLHENLSVLTSGHLPTNPAELISSNTMSSLLEEVKAEYDYVIMDLPPVLAVSDAIAISKHLSGSIVVVKHYSTKRREIKDVVRQFDYVEAKILGFVYNISSHVQKPGYSSKYYGRYVRYEKYRDHYEAISLEAAEKEKEQGDPVER